MKEKFYTYCFFAICVGFFLSSCQKEESELIDETPTDTITADSVLGQILLSASQNNGSIDDLIDGNSCFSLKFPITVNVNSQVVLMESLADIQTILLIINQSQTDEDTIELVFPIEIVFEDYSVHMISNLQEMSTTQINCPNFISDTYSCVSFLYPISCYTYNSDSEQTGFVTMNNDGEWYEYLTYLADGIIIAIDYDMTIVMNGELRTVTSNQELTAVMAETDCESITDVIHPEVIELRNIMKDRTWYVSQFLNNGVDETSGYQDYNLDFRDSIAVFAFAGGSVVYGVWIITHQNEELNFALSMDSLFGEVNNDEYKIVVQTENELTFVTKNSDGVVEDTLVLTQN